MATAQKSKNTPSRNKRTVSIFGKNFAGPRGLRLSPGSNPHAKCVARQLRGKKTGDPRAAFRAASTHCKANVDK